MAYILLGVILLVIFLLIAVRVGVSREKPDDQATAAPVIHKSGIYSIVRRSPRDTIANHKPSSDEIRKYLDSKNEEINRHSLSDSRKRALIDQWEELLERNISEVEAGDREGVEFYRYDYPDSDYICDQAVPKDCFVSREQIFNHPGLIPPFHLGCTCELARYHGDENFRDTGSYQFRRIFDTDRLSGLPEWKQILANDNQR